MQQEDLIKLQIRYLSDRRIASLQSEKIAVLNCAIPCIILKENGEKELIFEQKVMYEIDRINKILIEYIEEHYPELRYKK